MEIKEFQELMLELYAHNDRRRGKDRTMLWLVEEVGELAEAVWNKSGRSVPGKISL